MTTIIKASCNINLHKKKANLIRKSNAKYLKSVPCKRSTHITKVFKENIEASKQIIEFTHNHYDELEKLMNYSIFQLSSWIMPMTIAGRLMKMDYKEIANGLVIIALIKSALNFYGIIHY